MYALDWKSAAGGNWKLSQGDRVFARIRYSDVWATGTAYTMSGRWIFTRTKLKGSSEIFLPITTAAQIFFLSGIKLFCRKCRNGIFNSRNDCHRIIFFFTNGRRILESDIAFFDTYRMSSQKLFYSTKIEGIILTFPRIVHKVNSFRFQDNARSIISSENHWQRTKRKCDKGGILFGTKPG